MDLSLTATELLLLMIAVNLLLFAVGWAVAALSLTHHETTLRGFFGFNATLALALALMAFRGDEATPLTRIVPNVLILISVAMLTRGVYAFWSAYVPSRRFYVPLLASALGIVWFGAMWPHDHARAGALVVGLLWLVVGAIWRTYSPTRAEFGLGAAIGLTITGALVFVVVSMRGTLALLTNEPINLNEASFGSEFGLFIVLFVVTMPNLIYANFVAIRMLRRSDQAARSDSLTGLLNHRAFMERADEDWSSRRAELRTGAAMAIDLDYFKRINDEHGHNAGDEVLRSFAEILRNTFDESHIVGRTGGEEFIVIHSPATRDSVARMAERLMRRVNRARWMARDTGEIRLTVSIGIALDAETDLRPNDLLMRADQALYAAKAQGRNCIVYS